MNAQSINLEAVEAIFDKVNPAVGRVTVEVRSAAASDMVKFLAQHVYHCDWSIAAEIVLEEALLQRMSLLQPA